MTNISQSRAEHDQVRAGYVGVFHPLDGNESSKVLAYADLWKDWVGTDCQCLQVGSNGAMEPLVVERFSFSNLIIENGALYDSPWAIGYGFKRTIVHLWEIGHSVSSGAHDYDTKSPKVGKDGNLQGLIGLQLIWRAFEKERLYCGSSRRHGVFPIQNALEKSTNKACM